MERTLLGGGWACTTTAGGWWALQWPAQGSEGFVLLVMEAGWDASCVVDASQQVAVHARQQSCPDMGMSPLYCAGTSSLPPLASPGCLRIDINSSMDDDLFSESFLNGIFIVNVRQVFLLGRNTGQHVLGSRLFIILTCSALPRKSRVPFNIGIPGQDAPGESPWKEYSFRETAAGWNEHWSSSVLWLASRNCCQTSCSSMAVFPASLASWRHCVRSILPSSQHGADPDLAQQQPQAWAHGEAAEPAPSAPWFWMVSSSELPGHCLFGLGQISDATPLCDVESCCLRSTSFWIWVAFLSSRCQSGQFFFFFFSLRIISFG